MKLDITELLRVPTEPVEFLVDEPSPSDLGVECRSRVTGRLVFSSTSNLLMIRGDVYANLTLECVRCLEPVAYCAHAEISEEFRIRDFTVVSGADQPEDEELDESLLAVFNGGELDLDEYLRQHLLLAVPSFPVCRDDCRGLCPHCGANLNVTSCNCAEAGPVDSPFADLARRFGLRNGM
ncbi:MAG: YceD family protein [Armatimonadota bacterium]